MNLSISNSKKIGLSIGFIIVNTLLVWILYILGIPMYFVLPMNFFILTASLTLGRVYGLIIGITSIFISSYLFKMPPVSLLFLGSALQYGIYGFLTDSIYEHRQEPISSIAASLVFGIVAYLLTFFLLQKFVPDNFFGGVTDTTTTTLLNILFGLPSLALQIYIVPKMATLLKNRL